MLLVLAGQVMVETPTALGQAPDQPGGSASEDEGETFLDVWARESSLSPDESTLAFSLHKVHRGADGTISVEATVWVLDLASRRATQLDVSHLSAPMTIWSPTIVGDPPVVLVAVGTMDMKGELWSIPLAPGGKAKAVIANEPPIFIRRLAFTKRTLDGTLALSVIDGFLCAIDPRSGEYSRIPAIGKVVSQMFDLAPDGQAIVFSRWDKVRGVSVVQLHQPGKPARELLSGRYHRGFMRFSPDSQWLVWEVSPAQRDEETGLWRGEIRLLHLDGESEPVLLRDYCGRTVWSPDSSSLVCRRADRSLWRVDVSSLGENLLIGSEGGGFVPIAWLRSGKILLKDWRGPRLYTIDPDGTDLDVILDASQLRPSGSASSGPSGAPAEIAPADVTPDRLRWLFAGPYSFDRALLADVFGNGAGELVILALDGSSERPFVLAKVSVYVRDDEAACYRLAWESREIGGFGVERFEARPLARPESDDVLLTVCGGSAFALTVFSSADAEGLTLRKVLHEPFDRFEVVEMREAGSAKIATTSLIWKRFGEDPPDHLKGHVVSRTTYWYAPRSKRFVVVDRQPDTAGEESFTLTELLHLPGATVYFGVTERPLDKEWKTTECLFEPKGLLATKLSSWLRRCEKVRAVFRHTREDIILEYLGPASP